MGKQVASIGAGMAGLSAAERLRAQGIAVTLFEKSRGFGGRMSTRRSGEFQFDHGAQYFSVRGADFKAQMALWQADVVTGEWFDGAFVGMPGMTAPARAMAASQTCITEALVSSLTRGPAGWSLHDDKGLIDAPGNGQYAAAILAVPAPQAVPLAASAGVEMPGLGKASYAPCIALMLAFPADTARPAQNWMKPEGGPISWIAQDSSKPGRPQTAQTWVVHASADWSRARLDLDPTASGEILLQHFRALTGINAEPLYTSAHRWRYALVEQALGAPFLFDAETRLGACGDWCLGPRVEAAFESGFALGKEIARALA